MGEVLERVLDRVRSLGPKSGADGYVEFQGAPYRGHRMIVDTVLAHTKPGDYVLEGGVSSGYLAAEVVRAGRHVDGIEIDPETARLAEKVCDRVIVADLQELDLEELRPTYQAVLFGDTLEHLMDPTSVLVRLKAVLASDGTLVVSIPNVANWSVRVGLLFGRWEYKDRGLLDRTHLRFFTRRTAVRLVEDAGYRVESVVAAVPAPLITWRPLCALIHRAGNMWQAMFAYTFIITARPR